jgi:diacylglycerol kinase (ATP)
MRITLMHNPKAGGGKHDKKELMSALSQAGHEVVYQSTKKEKYEKVLDKATDLVLIAGGDGTVTKVARRLIDTGIAISILPLGTANNIARSLGFGGTVDEIISGLTKGTNRAFDVAVVRGPWGKRYVLEGVGAGLLADYVRAADKKKTKGRKGSKEQELARHISELRRMLGDYSARHWNIEIDGKDVSGTYILWEAMNIRSVGPALYLAPWAETKDGEFDFVAVREDDRDLLLGHFDARLAGKKNAYPLPMRTFRELEIVVEKSRVHLDDKIWPKKKAKPDKRFGLRLTVKAGALLIRQPARNQNPSHK